MIRTDFRTFMMLKLTLQQENINNTKLNRYLRNKGLSRQPGLHYKYHSELILKQES